MSTRNALAVLRIAGLLVALVLAAGIGIVAAIRAVVPAPPARPAAPVAAPGRFPWRS